MVPSGSVTPEAAEGLASFDDETNVPFGTNDKKGAQKAGPPKDI